MIRPITSLEVERDDDQVLVLKWSVFFVNIVIKVNSLSHTIQYPDTEPVDLDGWVKKQQHFISFPSDKTWDIMLEMLDVVTFCCW